MTVILRPEALAPGRLAYFQFEAAKRLVNTLEAAVDDLASPPGEATPWRAGNSNHVDSKRASRLFFLSGEPGTGKTSLYLALREALEGKNQKQELNFSEGVDEEKKPIRLDKLTHRIVWLAPLDLEIAATSTTNYLAAVVTRIERVITDAPERRSESRGLLEHSSGYSEALMEFQRLKTEIGLAWDGSLQKRAETMDPDAYAEEVLRGEDARLCINERLNKVLENLIGELHGFNNPMFVLPVDDLYLNPRTSLEFLRLMRMISSPRLFILAMGEFKIIEELFFQKMLGELISIAGEASYVREKRQRRVLTARARRLTSHSLRKLLPPAQRYQMEVLIWSETLDLCPAKEGPGGPSLGERPLGHLLELFPLELKAPLGRKTLMAFLRLPGNPEVRSSYAEDKKNRIISPRDAVGYTGLQVLELPLRNALDVWMEFAQALPLQDGQNISDLKPQDLWKEDPSKEELTEKEQKSLRRVLMGVVVEQALQALNEQDFVSNDDRETFEAAISGTEYIPQRLDTSLIEFAPEFGPPIELGLGGQRFEFCSHRRWLLYANGTDGDSLPPRPTAWFVLLHDLLVLLKGESLHKPSTPIISSEVFSPADKTGQNSWARKVLDDGSGDSRKRQPWPLPKWPSFWQFDIFLCAWGHVLDKVEESEIEDEKKVESLFYHWVDLATRVLLFEFPDEFLDKTFFSSELKEVSWDKEHIDKLKEVTEDKSRHPKTQRGAKVWLKRLQALNNGVKLQDRLAAFLQTDEVSPTSRTDSQPTKS